MKNLFVFQIAVVDSNIARIEKNLIVPIKSQNNNTLQNLSNKVAKICFFFLFCFLKIDGGGKRPRQNLISIHIFNRFSQTNI